MSTKAIKYLESLNIIDKVIFIDACFKINPSDFNKFKSSHIAALSVHDENSRSYNMHLNRVRKLYIELNKKPTN